MSSNTNTINYNLAIGTAGSLIATSNSNTIGNIITTGGNVGVGTTSPNYKLDVNGSMRATSGDATLGTLEV